MYVEIGTKASEKAETITIYAMYQGNRVSYNFIIKRYVSYFIITMYIIIIIRVIE